MIGDPCANEPGPFGSKPLFSPTTYRWIEKATRCASRGANSPRNVLRAEDDRTRDPDEIPRSIEQVTALTMLWTSMLLSGKHQKSRTGVAEVEEMNDQHSLIVVN